MARINQRGTGSRHRAVVQPRSSVPDVVNHEGVPAFGRDVKSELFLLGATLFAGEDTFYESATDRDARFKRLVAEAVRQDPAWTAKFLRWLRSEGNIRTASVIGAVEYGRAFNAYHRDGSGSSPALVPGEYSARSVLRSVFQRADEPGEALAYWLSEYGRPLPKWLKRGLFDAALELYTEFSTIKYDTDRSAVRFGDVIEMSHADGAKGHEHEKDPLFRHLLERRRGRGEPGESLPVLATNQRVRKMDPKAARDLLLSDPEFMRKTGMTWEALSGYGAMDAAAWEAVIPRMGYMALLRNLRNFTEAGVSPSVLAAVEVRLTDPGEVERSRQLPFRFLSAYMQLAHMDRWNHVLATALDLSARCVPAFKGRTLVLLDTSASMQSGMSGKSVVSCHMAGALFAGILNLRSAGSVRMVEFGNYAREVEVRPGTSALAFARDSFMRSGHVGHGTDIDGALKAYRGEDRVVLFSDMQTQRYVSSRPSAPVYAFDLTGYGSGLAGAAEKNWYDFGGLTDKVFTMVPLLEDRASGRWPWES